MNKNGNDKLALSTAQLVTDPRKVRPTLLSVDNVLADNWQWVNLMDLLFMVHETRRRRATPRQLFELGNSTSEGTIRCIVQKDHDLEPAEWTCEQFEAWVKYIRGEKTPADVARIHWVLVPAGFAMNLLNGVDEKEAAEHTQIDSEVNHEVVPAEESIVIINNKLRVVRPSQYKMEGVAALYAQTKWYWVSLDQLIAVKHAENPFEVGMWEAGFADCADPASARLTCVLNVVTSVKRIGWDEWETAQHHEIVELTFDEFVDIWNRRVSQADEQICPFARQIFVPAGFAAKVLKGSSTGSKPTAWDPTRLVPVGVVNGKH